MKKYLYFTVRVPIVPEVSAGRFRSYIEEAVSAWGGQFEPAIHSNGAKGDPLGPPCVLMEKGAVKVTQQRKIYTKALQKRHSV